MNRTIVHLSRGREWRGGERQVLLLARTVAARHTVPQHLFTRAESPLALMASGAGLSVLPLPWTTAWSPLVLTTIIRQLHAIRSDRRQVVLHAHDSHALGFALFAGRSLRLTVVVTRRSMTAAGRLWRHADRVIAISAAVRDRLVADGVRGARITLVPSAIPDDALCPTAAPPSPVHHRTRIVAVGALTAEKGHATLLDAFAALDLPEAQLVIVGSGPEEGALRARAERLGITARVTILPDGDESAGVIHDADLFVQPSLREALGTMVLAAMARGVPIVASHTGGLVELLDGGAGLLAPIGDADALTAMLRRGALDAGLREAMVAVAHQRVRQYGAARMADQMMDVYGSVHCDP